MRRLAVLALAGLTWGCASADPNVWLLYAKAAHLYGRVEAKTEMLCAVPRRELADFCQEAAKTRDAIAAMNPVIQAELVKKEPDWPRILQYVDLVFSLAAKAL